MNNKWQYQKRYALLLLLSLLIHTGGYVSYLASRSPVPFVTRPEQTVTVKLKQQTLPKQYDQESTLIDPTKPKEQALLEGAVEEYDPRLDLSEYKFGEKESSSNQIDPSATDLDYGINQASEKKRGLELERAKESEFVATEDERARKEATGFDGENDRGRAIDTDQSIEVVEASEEANQSDGVLDGKRKLGNE